MERSKIKIKLNLILLPALLILIACTQTAPVRLATENFKPPLPANCWLLQPEGYKLRQSAKLEYKNSEEFFEGFMELDLQQNRAQLVIFTALGVTLLNLEIKPHSFTFANTGPHNIREQHFAAAVAGSVQKIFFSFRKHSDPKSQLQVNLHNTSGSAELSRISAKQSNPNWIVTYSDYHDYPCGRLPQRIILQNHRPEFKLTLWLHKAEIKKSDPQ